MSIPETTIHRTLNGTHVAYTAPAGHDPRALLPAVPNVPTAPELPEAPVSMNLFVDLPGQTQRAQVTARGFTATEAAQTLKASVDALQAAFAPVPPPSRTERLAALLACGTAKALAAGDENRLDRLIKAYGLVVHGLVEQITADGIPQGRYEVRSQTQPERLRYEVYGQSCECQDARQHAEDKGWYCKHSIAALYMTRLDAQEQAF